MWPSSLFILNHEKKGFNLHFVGIFRNQSRHNSLSSSDVKAPALSTNYKHDDIHACISKISQKSKKNRKSLTGGWITCLVTNILNVARGFPIA